MDEIDVRPRLPVEPLLPHGPDDSDDAGGIRTHRRAVNRILDDLIDRVKPRWMEVVGDFNVRGGIKLVVRPLMGSDKRYAACVRVPPGRTFSDERGSLIERSGRTTLIHAFRRS